jgi:hypothetical protein
MVWLKNAKKQTFIEISTKNDSELQKLCNLVSQEFRAISGFLQKCLFLDGHYLAEFCYRFNRRFLLEDMIPRLGNAAVRTPPMPQRLLSMAEAWG